MWTSIFIFQPSDLNRALLKSDSYVDRDLYITYYTPERTYIPLPLGISYPDITHFIYPDNDVLYNNIASLIELMNSLYQNCNVEIQFDDI